MVAIRYHSFFVLYKNNRQVGLAASGPPSPSRVSHLFRRMWVNYVRLKEGCQQIFFVDISDRWFIMNQLLTRWSNKHESIHSDVKSW
jgi:hypothetical protein